VMCDACMLCRSTSVVALALGGDEAVDTLVKDAARRIHGKKLLIILDHVLVVLSQSRDLIYVLDRIVRAVACDLASGVRKHARKLLVFALTQRINNK
jgi:hypothetical protein